MTSPRTVLRGEAEKPMRKPTIICGLLLCWFFTPAVHSGDKDKSGITIDKEKKLILIDAKIAPRKLPHLKEIYPLEVIACWPHPKGKKAHETVVTIEAKPSAVHAALVKLGLKPGTPVMGESKDPPQGPDVKVSLAI